VSAGTRAPGSTRLPWQACERCGALGVDAQPDGPVVTLLCPRCGHEEERRRLPFSVTGPSGSGKSTVMRRLWRELPECGSLDGDVLRDPAYWNARAAFYTRWLNLTAQISQTGRVVDELLSRLEARARPRDPDVPPDVLEQTRIFNGWLRTNLDHVDTSTSDPDETAARVASWVRARL
jgi:hypothetical protein